MKINVYFWSYLAYFSSEWELFQTNVLEKIKTHVLGSVNSPPPPAPENRAVYEVMWKNIVEPGRP